MPGSTQQHDFLGIAAVVASDRMREVLALAARVARTSAAVLIEGESGSGKEIVARAIHQMSLRCPKPWVDISCGALPEHLMESELFGHEKGAFSGAETAKPGLFELAHTGTLFLDEIGELEPRMQVKLLRVLDGVPYYRLGGTKKVGVDVRVLAATNRDLERSCSEGQFRNDLFHRLSQLRIVVPPLRERLDDIEPLCHHFLTLQGLDESVVFSADALELMRAYRWPGNIRELRNVVTRAAILATDGRVRAADLQINQPVTAPRAGGSLATMPPPSGTSLDGMERQAILNVLEQTNGHRQRAAELLGISRRTLSRKLKQYSIEEADAGQIPFPATRPWSHERELSGKTA